jgi:hypothetical protein
MATEARLFDGLLFSFKFSMDATACRQLLNPRNWRRVQWMVKHIQETCRGRGRRGEAAIDPCVNLALYRIRVQPK